MGALRRAPPRWQTDHNGVAFIDRVAPGNADEHGSLDPTALYQALKRFLRRCGAMAWVQGANVDAAGLERAFTH